MNLPLKHTVILCVLFLLISCKQTTRTPEASPHEVTANTSSLACTHTLEFPFDLNPDALVVPYPNDIFTVPDPTSHTGRRVSVDNNTWVFKEYFGLLSYWLRAYETLEGFGLYADLFVPLADVAHTVVDTPIHDTRSGVFVMVSDPTHRFFGDIAPMTVSLEKHTLRLTPRVPLLENTQYALVVTDDWQRDSGLCFTPSASMTQLAQGNNSTSYLTQHAEVLAHLAQANISRERVLAISPFTTLPVFPDMDRVHTLLDQHHQHAPATLTDWQFSPTESPRIQAMVQASLDTPMFGDSWGIWRNNPDKQLAIENIASLPVQLSLPNPETIAHAQPYPLVIYMHGTSKSRHDVADVADWFAGIGMATIGMDALCHGDRPNLIGVESLCYYNFINPLTWRDNGRETVAGILWLIKAIQHLAEIDVIPEGGDGIPDFDVENIYFMGVSLGAIQGGVLAGITSDIDGYIFNVAGAKFTDIAFDHSIVRSILSLTHGIDSIAQEANLTHGVYLAGMVFQSILDASDPGVFLYNARQLRDTSYDALQQGAAYDNQVSGTAGASFARAGGWPQVSPSVWETGLPIVNSPHLGSGFVQYDTQDHDMIWRQGAFSFQLQNQLQHFLSHLHREGSGEIVIPDE